MIGFTPGHSGSVQRYARHMDPVFPTVIGSSLSQVAHTLPGSLVHPRNLLLIAFKQRQQDDVNTWLPVAAEVAAEFGDLGVFELPVISRAYRPVSGFIDGGMRAGIPDRDVRDATITLYIDRGAFARALEIESFDAIVPMLVTPAGSILWRTVGPMAEDAVAELRRTLESGMQ